MTSRREALRLLAGTALCATARPARAQTPLPRPALPRVNGGINVHGLRRLDPDPAPTLPLLIPELVTLQLRALYELGFSSMRTTLTFNRFGADFLATIPYVRAARALGVDVLGLISQPVGFDLAQALSQTASREAVLRTYVEIFAEPVAPAPGVPRAGNVAFQILNEPALFLGVAPGAYVRRFLEPCYDTLKSRAPDLTVVAAAEVSGAASVLRTRAMLEAGLEDVCDRVAYHIYDRSVLGSLSGMARRPVLVTETGADGTPLHLDWVTRVMPEIRARIPETEELFLYVLFDGSAGRFRLLQIAAEPAGGFTASVESIALVDYFARRVAEAAGGGERAAYAELIPDLTPYLATPEDLESIAAVGRTPGIS